MGNYSYGFYDLNPIPDVHNTGCHGKLTLISESDIFSSLESKIGTIRLTKTIIDNVKTDNGCVFKNINFKNASLYIGDTSTKLGISENPKIIFKNCNFDSENIDGSRPAYCFNITGNCSDDYVVLFENCTFSGANAASVVLSKGTCIIKNCYAHGFGGDCFKIGDRIKLINCYAAQAGLSTGSHADGFQFSSGGSFYVDNYRCDAIAIKDINVYNAGAYIDYELGDITTLSEGHLSKMYINGGGYTFYMVGADGYTLQNVEIDNCQYGCSYRYGALNANQSYRDNFNTDENYLPASTCWVTSVWRKRDKIKFLVTNYTNEERHLIIRTNNGVYNFTIPKCPTYAEYYNTYTSVEQFPFNLEYEVDNADWFVAFDGEEKEENQIRYTELDDELCLVHKSKMTSLADAVRTAKNVTYDLTIDDMITLLLSSGGRPEVPQTGTWQLKTTTDKKYVILGTDDDVPGNTKYFRMLRSYGFPYTMNTEAEFLDRELGADTADYFTDSDAPSVFPNGAKVIDLAKYLVSSGLGETAQHGSSSCTLWNSNKLTGTTLTSVYNTYVENGGTKTESEFKTAVLTTGKSTDIAQGASYVSESRESIEDALGSYVYTLGIWGGEPYVVIDGINVNLKSCRDYGYNFRADNYIAAGTSLSTYKDNTSPYDITRTSTNLGSLDVLKNNVSVGKVIELFIHNTEELDITKLRSDLAELKSMVTAGEVAVVTRKQYAELGEYVSNPIKSISVTRTSTTINVGDTDSKDEYTVTATYNDNTTADVTSEAIVKIITDTSEAKAINVPAYYRGFTATVGVEVSGGTSIYIDPYIITGAKIGTTGGIASGTGKVFRYDVTGYDTVYFNSSKNQQYAYGFSEEELTTGTLTGYTTRYLSPTATNTITIPEGCNYLYFNSPTSNGYDTYPWTVTTQIVQ